MEPEPEPSQLTPEQAAEFERAYARAPIAVTRLSVKTGRFLAANDRAVELYGYSREELSRRTFLELTHPEDVARSKRVVTSLKEQTFDDVRGVEKRYVRSDGSTIWTVIHVTVIHDEQDAPLHYLTFTTDLTPIRRAEMLRGGSRRVLELVARGRPLSEALDATMALVREALPEAVCALYTVNNRRQVLEPVAWEGLDETEDAGLDPISLDSNECRLAVAVKESRSLVFGPDRPDGPIQDGCLEPFSRLGLGLLRFEPIRGPSGESVGALLVGRAGVEDPLAFDDLLDTLTQLSGIAIERHRIESALIESEKTLADTLDCIGDAMIATDISGRITRTNPAAEQIFSLTSAGMIGRPLDELFRIAEPDSDVPLADPFHSVLEEGSTLRVAETVELLLASGERRPINHSASPIRDNEGCMRGMVIVFRDVTDRLQLESQLHHARKMEAIGKIAGGVAHDFNNLLSGINGFASLLYRRVREDETSERYARSILDSTKRASELTASLLSFARRGRPTVRVMDLHELLGEVVTLVEHSFDRRIAIERDFQARRSNIRGDRSQLHNAILNIALNARDAMPEGGVLSLRTRETRVRASDRLLEPSRLEPGLYVELTVEDTGQGMDREVLDRIFEPFFTTKEVGKGTGLGLATVYGTVKNHEGAIRVDSTPGVGTRFQLYFKLKGSTGRTESGRLRVEEVPDGAGRVLVIDDDEVVRELACELLSSLGYEAVPASDGESGIETYVKQPESFDLVLLDMMMPGIGGREVARRLRGCDPRVSILVATGYCVEAELEGLRSEGVAGVLEKPFGRVELARALKEALSGRASAGSGR